MSRWENKYVIGLTGNIAVGKSVVRQMLQHVGAYPIDADALAHQAMMPGAPAFQPVIETFGKFMLAGDGQIDRARLGALVFAVPEALTALEAIVHPAVDQAIQALVARAKQRVIVVEAIKLLETNLVDVVDAVWVVDASPESQIRRLTEKRKMSTDEARKRILAQNAQADKLAQADVVIKNDGSVEETWKQVQFAWNQIRKTIGDTQTLPSVKRQTSSLTPIPRQQGASQSSADLKLVDPKTQIVVRRGMPGNAEAIANFISLLTRKPVGRMDIMLAFGQKSFHIAYGKSDQVIGLIGWTVENLITRVDEFYIAPNVPYHEIIRDLIAAIEDASRELQSEVCFVVLPDTTRTEVLQALVKTGYQPLRLSEVKFPAWREAAHEMLSDSTMLALLKPLRAERIMKPI